MTTPADDVTAAASAVLERFDRWTAMIRSLAARGDSGDAMEGIIAFMIAQLRDMAPAWESLHLDGLALEAAWNAGRAALLAEQELAAGSRRHLRVAGG